MATSDPTVSSLSDALSYPKHGDVSNNNNGNAGGSSNSTTPSTSKDDKRIYVGNLDPTIDEYTVLKLFSPFGKITKLDFMFHWHGPKKGTPRGYCFLEFESASQAAAAVAQMNRKAIKMRPLSVSLANMAGALKNATTDEKIRAMERKLAQMAQPPKMENSKNPGKSGNGGCVSKKMLENGIYYD
ncbi:hypothetical protein BGZ99_001285 [Dissophora globulifera]|uniref:RRM domain-containing protein n=1 Tax=Dissophora globulifera TaxID=979702 RepID=A0A9P6RP30_9FUNG|nr:hypothetical protein BGZ99_001285 [Dissophora globulifera]